MNPSARARDFGRRVPASLDAVEEFCRGVRNWAEAWRLPNAFAVELVTREAVTNAAVHGCGCDPAKQIRCLLRRKTGRIIIAVRDPGPGFDVASRSLRPPADEACCGRGLEIMRLYAHRVRFDRRGNTITIIQHFEEGTP